MNSEQQDEWLTCAESAGYFIHHYCQVYDASPAVAAWIPFHLWPAQKKVLRTLQSERLVVILKARQIGMTWLTLGRALWLMEFHPKATIGLFSRRDDEAIDLIDFRLKGMHERLPDWMKSQIESSNNHEYVLSNGSRAKAFPPNAGDSYTFTLAIADEFDLVPDQGHLMRSVKPAIDAGGSMILLSRADKNKPESEFKRIYAAAKEGKSTFKPIFLSWQARPDRTPEWYEEQRRECESRGAIDDLYEQYPTTDNEALSMRGAGLVYPVWSEENVTEKADYIKDGGPLFWGADDGTAGKIDPVTRHYTGDSHPRTFGIYQLRNNGDLCLFYENYAVSTLPEVQLAAVLKDTKENGWPLPEFVVVDKSAAELKIRIHGAGMYTRNGASSVEESIKGVMGWLAPDMVTGYWRFTIHPRCKETIYEYNNYRRNSDDGRIIKAFDHGCLVAETEVATSEGEKKITDIKQGDLVLTSAGYQPVKWSGQTGNKETVKVTFSNGACLEGTHDHPIFTQEYGFVPLGFLMDNDIITISLSIGSIKCTENQESIQKKSLTRALNFGAILTQKTIQTASILGQGQRTLSTAFKRFTEKFGKTITGKYQTALKSITLTETQPTTIFQILKLLPVAITGTCTEKRQKSNCQFSGLELNTLGNLRQSGTEAKRGENGIASNQKRCGRIENFVSRNASNAGIILRQIQIKFLSFARTIASHRQGEKAVLTTKKEPALFANRNSRQTGIQKISFARVRVLQKIDTGAKPVYNLEVDGKAHEYFANGVLVHNCDRDRYLMHALRYERQ